MTSTMTWTPVTPAAETWSVSTDTVVETWTGVTDTTVETWTDVESGEAVTGRTPTIVHVTPQDVFQFTDGSTHTTTIPFGPAAPTLDTAELTDTR